MSSTLFLPDFLFGLTRSLFAGTVFEYFGSSDSGSKTFIMNQRHSSNFQIGKKEEKGAQVSKKGDWPKKGGFN